MSSKGSKYHDILRINSRYKISSNPIHVLFESQLFRSAEAAQDAQKIKEIIEQELPEGFTIGGHADFNYLLDNVKTYDDFLDDRNRKSDVKLCSLFIYNYCNSQNHFIILNC